MMLVFLTGVAHQVEVLVLSKLAMRLMMRVFLPSDATGIAVTADVVAGGR